MKIESKNSKSMLYSYLLILFIVIRTINITLNEIFMLNSKQTMLLKCTILAIFLLTDLFIFLMVNKKTKIIFLVLEFAMIFLLLITTLRYRDLGLSVFLNYSWLVLAFIPILICFLSITDVNIFFAILTKSSFLISALCTLIYFCHIRKISTNLVFSYTLLLPYLIHLSKAIEEKNIFYIILVLFESYMMVTYASRGTLICILFFFLLLCIKKYKLKSFLPIGIVFILLVVLYFIFYKFNIFTHIYQYYMAKGKYFRIMDLLSSGSFFDNNGRFDIYKNYLSYIIKHPIIGNGVGANLVVGIFPHNLFIEIIFNFGIFSILICYYIYYLLKEYFITYFDKDTDNIFLILLSSGVFPLFFSSTYLEWMYFWVFIGFLLLIRYKQNL